MFYIIKKGLKDKWYFYDGSSSSLHMLDAYPCFSKEEAMDIVNMDGLIEYQILTREEAEAFMDKRLKEEI